MKRHDYKGLFTPFKPDERYCDGCHLSGKYVDLHSEGYGDDLDIILEEKTVCTACLHIEKER